MLNGSFVHSNFMGSGERLAVELVSGRYSQSYSISHTDPYTTVDGLSRTLGLQFRDITQFVSAASDFSTQTMSASIEFGYPITEFQGLRFGLVAQKSDLVVNPLGSAREAVTWVPANGNPYSRVVATEVDDPDCDSARRHDRCIVRHQVQHFRTRDRLVLRFTQSRDLRGSRHAAFAFAVGGGTRQRGQLLRLQLRLPAAVPAVASAGRSPSAAELGYGEALGKDTTAMPPYRQFFVGGPDSVRGFTESRLGPKDSFGNPYGGNMKIVGRAELLFPVPQKWRASTRISVFFDIGNVFSQGGGVEFRRPRRRHAGRLQVRLQ